MDSLGVHEFAMVIEIIKKRAGKILIYFHSPVFYRVGSILHQFATCRGGNDGHGFNRGNGMGGCL
jgi:hypothetical protein